MLRRINTKLTKVIPSEEGLIKLNLYLYCDYCETGVLSLLFDRDLYLNCDYYKLAVPIMLPLYCIGNCQPYFLSSDTLG